MMNAGFLTNNIDVQKNFVPSSRWKMWYKIFLGNNKKSKPVNLT